MIYYVLCKYKLGKQISENVLIDLKSVETSIKFGFYFDY